jgi:CRP/FNR family cyclic AMP-dependent transcriptional regulator
VRTTRNRPTLSHLRDVELFRGCSERQLRHIDSLTCLDDAPAGTVLCRQGSFGRQTFVVVFGEAEVTIDGAVVATLGPGSFFGELSVLDGDPRVATVTARTPMTLLVFSSQEFEVLLADVPRVARKMLATMGSRLRRADQALATS